MPEDPLPLARFNVLELTLARAGPTAARHLADWGANVLRVEPPKALTSPEDYTGKRFGPDRLNLHRNKRSLTLNLKEPEGKAIFMELVKTADVIVENMRSNVKHRLGIDYESVSKINPRIVYGSISGFGQTGPYKDRAGVDQIVQGMGGMMSITGTPESGPIRVGTAVIDLTAGGFLAQAILIALLEREVTGKGRFVHTSLLESMISLLDFQAARWLMAGEVAGQAGNNHPTSIPSGLFPTADGQILLAAAGDRLWERFCKTAGAEHFLENPDYKTGPDRLAHRDELNEKISEITRTRTSQYWFDLFSEAGVPCGPINTIDKVFADEQVQHLGMALPVTDPRLGPLTMVAQPNNIEGHSKDVRSPPAVLGEHTEEVLRDLGYDADRIADLKSRDIV
ncbi:CaiB/BaiF CoA transferase family protein [Roseitranquillus sediminis]|uniref:CaiB/BaiF CoA transferase family protein n=1 Tax=Roseitranquillus sediminis TaxID=2809051 RepID=UPI001D0C2375|nr:CaiB/BaiF CoA-transferase family protein [Roseitranquillus sediminis]MBM9595482.1 CoA transferase [Roseitranquillus sediminis]